MVGIAQPSGVNGCSPLLITAPGQMTDMGMQGPLHVMTSMGGSTKVMVTLVSSVICILKKSDTFCCVKSVRKSVYSFCLLATASCTLFQQPTVCSSIQWSVKIITYPFQTCQDFCLPIPNTRKSTLTYSSKVSEYKFLSLCKISRSLITLFSNFSKALS